MHQQRHIKNRGSWAIIKKKNETEAVESIGCELRG